MDEIQGELGQRAQAAHELMVILGLAECDAWHGNHAPPRPQPLAGPWSGAGAFRTDHTT